MNDYLRLCPACGRLIHRDDLLHDPDIQPIGMAFDDEEPELSFYYFNHQGDPCSPSGNRCGGTFTAPIEVFRDLVTEPIPTTLASGSPDCGRHCVRVDDLADCDRECSHAPYRRFLLHSLLGEREAGPDQPGSVAPTGTASSARIWPRR